MKEVTKKFMIAILLLYFCKALSMQEAESLSIPGQEIILPYYQDNNDSTITHFNAMTATWKKEFDIVEPLIIELEGLSGKLNVEAQEINQKIKAIRENLEDQKINDLEKLLTNTPANTTFSFFMMVRQEGINTYKNRLYDMNCRKTKNLTVFEYFRILTQYLQIVFDRLNDHDKNLVQEQLKSESQQYVAKLKEFHKIFQEEVDISPNKSEEDCLLEPWQYQCLDEMIKKFHMATEDQLKANRLCVSLGQSIAYQTIITQLLYPEKVDDCLLLPFSNGIFLAKMPELKGSIENRQDSIRAYFSTKRRVESYTDLTHLEQFMFKVIAEQSGLCGESAIFDQTETMGSIKFFRSLVTENDQKSDNMHYCMQVYDVENKERSPEGEQLSKYKENSLFKKLKNDGRLNIFNAFSIDENIVTVTRLVNRLLTAASDERNRICPSMPPECFLFGIPCIIKHGLKPSNCARINIAKYVDYCRKKNSTLSSSAQKAPTNMISILQQQARTRVKARAVISVPVVALSGAIGWYFGGRIGVSCTVGSVGSLLSWWNIKMAKNDSEL